MPDVFQGSLIRLRAIEASDWENFYQWNRDSEDSRLSYEIPLPSSREAVKAWAEKQSQPVDGDAFRLVIETLSGEFAGSINTHTVNPRCGTFRYGLALLPQHRRKGYASEAIRLVLRYCFHEKRYQKVNAEVFGFNLPSQQLHESLGFTLEGRLRRMIYTDGTFYDALIYGMTREEFEARNPIPSAAGSRQP